MAATCSERDQDLEAGCGHSLSADLAARLQGPAARAVHYPGLKPSPAGPALRKRRRRGQIRRRAGGRPRGRSPVPGALRILTLAEAWAGRNRWRASRPDDSRVDPRRAPSRSASATGSVVGGAGGRRGSMSDSAGGLRKQHGCAVTVTPSPAGTGVLGISATPDCQAGIVRHRPASCT